MLPNGFFPESFSRGHTPQNALAASILMTSRSSTSWKPAMPSLAENHGGAIPSYLKACRSSSAKTSVLSRIDSASQNAKRGSGALRRADTISTSASPGWSLQTPAPTNPGLGRGVPRLTPPPKSTRPSSIVKSAPLRVTRTSECSRPVPMGESRNSAASLSPAVRSGWLRVRMAELSFPSVSITASSSAT